MPSKASEVPLREIRDNIRPAQSFVEGFNLRTFRTDARTIYAVTRCLEIISEASRRLPTSLKSRHPGVSWKDIAGAGNVYRRDYEEISTDMIWNTIKALPELLQIVELELARSKSKPAERKDP